MPGLHLDGEAIGAENLADKHVDKEGALESDGEGEGEGDESMTAEVEEESDMDDDYGHDHFAESDGNDSHGDGVAIY